MTGHRPFRELTKGFALALHELRKNRAVSQEELAAKLSVGQPAVAKLERRTDMYVSNLRRYVEALGGTLEITARFPDGTVTIADVGGADSEKVKP
jgi:predicted transcriptional regulator